MHTIRADAYLSLALLSEKEGRADDALRYYMTISLLFDDAKRVPRAIESAIRILDRLERFDESKAMKAELKKRFPDYVVGDSGSKAKGDAE